MGYVVVTHGHDDHVGGARYLADRYGARVLMSPADRDLASGAPPADAPARDLEIADRQRLTLGGRAPSLRARPDADAAVPDGDGLHGARAPRRRRSGSAPAPGRPAARQGTT
ncbi:MBL fold metallo-hydrolase [Streptomyces sp. NPDC014995]|uniref:MBL fold metallo-hydrolase n=1 Tax=Streptomyces sp. NPDC014995 TaxID=3364936 RepID=UPI0036FB3DF8